MKFIAIFTQRNLTPNRWQSLKNKILKSKTKTYTLWYYAYQYKPKYDPNLGNIELQKKPISF